MTAPPIDITLLPIDDLPRLQFEAGETLFFEDDSGDCMYIIVSGNVNIVTFGRELEDVGPGGIVGEIALIDPMSPVQFSREGVLMIVMPVRASDPERIERPKLEPAVKSIPTPSTKSVNPLKPPRAKAKSTQSTRPTKKKAATRKVARKSKVRSSSPSTKIDPIGEAESRIAEANKALATAGKQLQSATGSLKTVRRQRSNDREELRGFRPLFSSIKKMATGDN